MLEQERQRYNDLKDTFDVELEKIRSGAVDQAMRDVQRQLESVDAKLAKDQIIRILEDHSIPQAESMHFVVTIIKSMGLERRRKILSEFKDEDDTERLHAILRQIRLGVPDVELIRQTRKPSASTWRNALIDARGRSPIHTKEGTDGSIPSRLHSSGAASGLEFVTPGQRPGAASRRLSTSSARIASPNPRAHQIANPTKNASSNRINLLSRQSNLQHLKRRRNSLPKRKRPASRQPILCPRGILNKLQR